MLFMLFFLLAACGPDGGSLDCYLNLDEHIKELPEQFKDVSLSELDVSQLLQNL